MNFIWWKIVSTAMIAVGSLFPELLVKEVHPTSVTSVGLIILVIADCAGTILKELRK